MAQIRLIGAGVVVVVVPAGVIQGSEPHKERFSVQMDFINLDQASGSLMTGSGSFPMYLSPVQLEKNISLCNTIPGAERNIITLKPNSGTCHFLQEERFWSWPPTLG